MLFVLNVSMLATKICASVMFNTVEFLGERSYVYLVA